MGPDLSGAVFNPGRFCRHPFSLNCWSLQIVNDAQVGRAVPGPSGPGERSDEEQRSECRGCGKQWCEGTNNLRSSGTGQEANSDTQGTNEHQSVLRLEQYPRKRLRPGQFA